VPTVDELIRVLDRLYPPSTAADWDAVGPVCGDPAAEVSTVLLAIDPVATVVDEALDLGAQLLVTHHPLYVRGTSTVYAGTSGSYKGRLVQRLVTGGCALMAVHTNGDVAVSGVAEALAAAIGLTGVVPLRPDSDGVSGSGRVGVLPAPMSLREFAAHVARCLPTTPAGVRSGGDPERVISRVAVSGGAGDDYLADATDAGVDAYVTADLRHHYSSEHLESGGPALVDPGHWATEWPWLPLLARTFTDAVAEDLGSGATVSVHVSERVTDPWTLHS
jgi:dinuclear metal center YbgI/SA1388 family protein